MSSIATTQNPGLSKKAAFFIHLTLSLLIFVTLVALMAFFWFPGKLFFLDGGWQGLKIVALIDVVLGPALTLLLYAPGKPKLVLDMSMIAMLQIGALVFGFVTTYQQRTVAIVYVDDTFNTLSASAMKYANAELAARNITDTQEPRELKKLDDATPAMLLFPAPGPGEFAQYIEELLSGYPEPHERSDKFQPLKGQNELLAKNALSDETLESINMVELVNKAIEKKGLNAEEIQVHPYNARFSKGVVIVDVNELTILDFVPVPKADTTADAATPVETAESVGE